MYLLPLDGKQVEGLAELLPTGQGDGVALVLVHAEVASPVGRAVNRAWLVPHQLHDVNLAALGPSPFRKIRPEHPQRWPYALSFRHFGPDVDAAKLKLLQVHRPTSTSWMPLQTMESNLRKSQTSTS